MDYLQTGCKSFLTSKYRFLDLYIIYASRVMAIIAKF